MFSQRQLFRTNNFTARMHVDRFTHSGSFICIYINYNIYIYISAYIASLGTSMMLTQHVNRTINKMDERVENNIQQQTNGSFYVLSTCTFCDFFDYFPFISHEPKTTFGDTDVDSEPHLSASPNNNNQNLGRNHQGGKPQSRPKPTITSSYLYVTS